MAKFFPTMIPVQLAARPGLAGEKRVWEALRATPHSAETCVFYNRAPKGCRRRADMILINPERGIVAIEVKGGLVHYNRGFRQQLSGDRRWRKPIEPWRQAKLALAQLFAILGLEPDAIPHAVVLAVPTMLRGGYPFSPGAHILTAEDLAPGALTNKLDQLLPRLSSIARRELAPVFDSIATALTRPGDEDNLIGHTLKSEAIAPAVASHWKTTSLLLARPNAPNRHG
jgi:hypothetical protein